MIVFLYLERPVVLKGVSKDHVFFIDGTLLEIEVTETKIEPKVLLGYPNSDFGRRVLDMAVTLNMETTLLKLDNIEDI